MDKVYVVYSGSVYEPNVDNIFSSKEKALDYCLIHNPNKESGEEKYQEYPYRPEYWVGEHELDPEVPDVPEERGYEVTISQDGSVNYVRPISINSVWNGDNTILLSGPQNGVLVGSEKALASPEELCIEQLLRQHNMQVDVFAKDEQHAVQLANETRLLLLEDNKWPTEYDEDGMAVLDLEEE